MDREPFFLGIVVGALIGVFGTGVPLRTVAGVPVHAALSVISGLVMLASVAGLLVVQYRMTTAN